MLWMSAVCARFDTRSRPAALSPAQSRQAEHTPAASETIVAPVDEVTSVRYQLFFILTLLNFILNEVTVQAVVEKQSWIMYDLYTYHSPFEMEWMKFKFIKTGEYKNCN